MTKIYLFLTLYLYSITAAAQSTNNVWAMAGYLGIDFNTSPPVALSTECYTLEGSASVSDANGQLLMYTGGNVVFNRNHQTMPNGSGLMGVPQPTASTSCTQGALIVPMPGNPLKYYIFSLEGYETLITSKGGSLWYSVVDMSLDNGRGDVVPGQKAILTDTALQEKLTAVAGCNNNVWVMVRSKLRDEFRAYEVTATGVSMQPVVSPTGFQAQLDDYMAGVIKFSPDGTQMVSVNLNYSVTPRSSVQLFDFDKSSGHLSNLRTLAQSPDFTEGYGACFSPGGSKLYVTKLNEQVWQYDLSQPTLPDIISSKALIYETPYRVFGDLQIAPDGKIYVSNLDAITQPEVAGAGCNYVVNAINYSNTPGTHYFGLPNVVVNAVPEDNVTYAPDVALHDTVVCLGVTNQVSITAYVSNAKPDAIYKWGPPAAIISAYGEKAIVNPELDSDVYLYVINGSTGDVCKQGSDADTMRLTLKECGCRVYLANAFTPNGDGLNDRFTLQTDGPDCGNGMQYVFSIYDRWGTLVFRETNQGRGWDGSYKGISADPGTYYYYVRYKTNMDKDHTVMKGDVTLVR